MDQNVEDKLDSSEPKLIGILFEENEKFSTSLIRKKGLRKKLLERLMNENLDFNVEKDIPPNSDVDHVIELQLISYFFQAKYGNVMLFNDAVKELYLISNFCLIFSILNLCLLI